MTKWINGVDPKFIINEIWLVAIRISDYCIFRTTLFPNVLSIVHIGWMR